MVQLAPSNDDFLSLHYTLEMQTKWYYLVQFSKKSMRKFVLIKKLRSKGQKKGHKAKILACSSVLNFFSWSIYASHTTFPSNFGVSIVSIPGPHEGWGQNTNPEYQLQPRVSTDLTSGAESAQKATSEIS